jgi:hypothetical protein
LTKNTKMKNLFSKAHCRTNLLALLFSLLFKVLKLNLERKSENFRFILS